MRHSEFDSHPVRSEGSAVWASQKRKIGLHLPPEIPDGPVNGRRLEPPVRARQVALPACWRAFRRALNTVAEQRWKLTLNSPSGQYISHSLNHGREFLSGEKYKGIGGPAGTAVFRTASSKLQIRCLVCNAGVLSGAELTVLLGSLQPSPRFPS
jgi:hypothetical protein